MKEQLHKTLQNQLDGYWSGSTAYHIVTKGGFLFDCKRDAKKELTPLGQMFMDQYKTSKESNETLN